jgi:hypothetical protein
MSGFCLSGDQRIDLRDKECMAKQQSLLKAESESNAIKGEQWAQIAQLKSTHCLESVWLLCGLSQAGGRNGHFCRWE